MTKKFSIHEWQAKRRLANLPLKRKYTKENINEGHGLSGDDVKILKTLISQIEQGTISSKMTNNFTKVLNFIVKSNIEQDKTKDLSKEKNELKVPYRKSGYMGYSEPVKKTK